jgi:hypothetical protein
MNKKQRALYDKAHTFDSPEMFARMMYEDTYCYDWLIVIDAILNDWEETTGGNELAVDEMEYNNL